MLKEFVQFMIDNQQVAEQIGNIVTTALPLVSAVITTTVGAIAGYIFKGRIEAKKAKAEAKNMELQEGLNAIAEVLSGIRAMVVAANNDGVVVPKFLDSCTCSGTTLDSVTITIKSRL